MDIIWLDIAVIKYIYITYLNDSIPITKTYLYNFDLLNPHLYIVKLWFTGVYIIFSYFCSKT